MKVDLSRSKSSVTDPGGAAWINKPTNIPRRDTKQVFPEKQRSIEPRFGEVSRRQIDFKYLSVRPRFQNDEESGEPVIQLIDGATGQVVRQIPPEELLHAIKVLRELKGMLFSAIS